MTQPAGKTDPSSEDSLEPAAGPAELDFSDEADGTPSRNRMRREFPPARQRELGKTGGEVVTETVDNEVTADDLSPETLLDDDPSHTPSARRRSEAADSNLREIDEAEAGLGHGKDEVELAEEPETRVNGSTRSPRLHR